jgi:hypothetical protein
MNMTIALTEENIWSSASQCWFLYNHGCLGFNYVFKFFEKVCPFGPIIFSINIKVSNFKVSLHPISLSDIAKEHLQSTQFLFAFKPTHKIISPAPTNFSNFSFRFTLKEKLDSLEMCKQTQKT